MLLLAVLAIMGGVMWHFARVARRSSQWVQHTLDVELALERLASHVRTAETSERGYLLTGEAEFLSSYQAATRQVREELTSLSGMTADNPAQREHIARLQPLLDGQFQFLQSLMEGYGLRGMDLLAIKARMDQQKTTASAIQALLAEMRNEEDQLLAAREIALSRARVRFYWTLFACYGVTIIIVGSLYVSVRRYSLQSAAAEARLSRLNEELDQRVQDRTRQLEVREELLNIFVKHVPAAVAMLDRNMRYMQVSDRWCQDYRIERTRFAGASHYELFPDIPERWKEIHRRCLGGETLREENDKWMRDDGSLTWLRWEIRPWGTRDGLPEGILIFSEDITSRKLIEETLRESEATIRTLLDTASQAIIAVDSEGRIALANRMVGEMFGYAPEELLGQPLEILIPPGLRDRHRHHREAFNSSPRRRSMGLGLDLTGIRRNGSEFPIEVSLSSVQSKAGLLAVSFVSDITARKQAELAVLDSERKLRSLAANLMRAQEDERRNLARELHDDITQHLAFLSIELGRLASESPASGPNGRERLEALQKQALRASSEVRRISHGLHPSVITDFGLSVALEEFCDEFAKGHGIAVDFAGLGEDSRLSDDRATCLYRIAQESMRNAVVHGRSRAIRVVLKATNDSVQLRVEDNGCGFAVESNDRSGLGLVSMRERIRLVNGTLTIASEQGHGSQIVASVPLSGVVHGEG